MGTDAIVNYEGVSFSYGRKTVLDGMHLALTPGQVTLLAAPNGTGKTTAAWLAAGLLRPSGGRVRVLGKDPYKQRSILGRVGFLAEGSPLPPTWRAREVLRFQKDTFPRWDESGCKRLIETFDLDLNARVKELSRGQRGKLGLACVLSTHPEVLILDEPTLGLDVATRRRLYAEILGRVSEQGCPILIASHDLAEAEMSGDRLVLLKKGKTAYDESIPDLLSRHRFVWWDSAVPAPPADLEVIELESRGGRRGLATQWTDDRGRGWLRRGGKAEEADLETIYLSLTGELERA